MVLFLVLLVGGGWSSGWCFQQKDALSQQESGQVREAQEIDRRTEVFLKIAERRLKALEDTGQVTPATPNPPASKKEAKKAQEKRDKEEETWGPPPTGTREQLLMGYTRVMDELEDKLDDAFERSPKSDALRKSLQLLSKTAETYLARLQHIKTANTLSPVEERALSSALQITQNASESAKHFLSQNPKAEDSKKQKHPDKSN